MIIIEKYFIHENLAYIYAQQKLHDKSLEYTKRILNPKNKNAFGSLRREVEFNN